MRNQEAKPLRARATLSTEFERDAYAWARSQDWKSCDIDNSLPVAARPQKATVIRQRPTKLRWSGCLRTITTDVFKATGIDSPVKTESRRFRLTIC